MAFGQDLHALSTESDAPIPFAAAFDEAQVISNARFTNPLWPITEFFTGERAKMREATKVLDDFAYRVIDEREREGRGNFVSSEKKEAADKDVRRVASRLLSTAFVASAVKSLTHPPIQLLSLYMALRDENGAPLTRTMLRWVITLLLASHVAVSNPLRLQQCDSQPHHRRPVCSFRSSEDTGR